MKIRAGFVSNSSSSSFTCAVCGNNESGYDASLSDFDMSECERGHTFCNSHQTKIPTITEIREDLIRRAKGRTYRKPEEIQEEVDKLTAMTEDEVQTEFEDVVGSSDVMPCVCPICTMERISEYDALRYLLVKNGLTLNDVLTEAKTRFNGDYLAFGAFIRPPKQ